MLVRIQRVFWTGLAKFRMTGRSKVLAKNAVWSLVYKGISIVLGFVFVPLYLNSVGQRQYGIILTITSISNFISFFDVGIGNGLRSKLGKAISSGDMMLGKKYVSTAYFYVSILFAGVFVLYILAAPFIDWARILNINELEIKNLNGWVFIVVGLFCLRFILQLVGSVLMADQRSALNDSMLCAANVLTMIICLVLKAAGALNFYVLLITMTALPVVALLIYSLYFFRNQYAKLRPSVKFVDHTIRRDLLSLGVKFFVIQIVALIIFSTTNILIAQLFDIKNVAVYNIAYKYYNVTVMIFVILMSPLWGAFTNAWYQDDVVWISKKIKQYVLISFAFIFINILQFLIYPFFINVWLHQKMEISILLVISFISYNFIYCYNNVFSHFLASIGQVNLQVYTAVVGGVINIPLTIYLAKSTHLGLSVILYANVICLLPSTLVTTVQSIQLIRKRRYQGQQK